MPVRAAKETLYNVFKDELGYLKRINASQIIMCMKCKTLDLFSCLLKDKVDKQLSVKGIISPITVLAENG